MLGDWLNIASSITCPAWMDHRQSENTQLMDAVCWMCTVCVKPNYAAIHQRGHNSTLLHLSQRAMKEVWHPLPNKQRKCASQKQHRDTVQYTLRILYWGAVVELNISPPETNFGGHFVTLTDYPEIVRWKSTANMKIQRIQRIYCLSDFLYHHHIPQPALDKFNCLILLD